MYLPSLDLPSKLQTCIPNASTTSPPPYLLGSAKIARVCPKGARGLPSVSRIPSKSLSHTRVTFDPRVSARAQPHPAGRSHLHSVWGSAPLHLHCHTQPSQPGSLLSLSSLLAPSSHCHVQWTGPVLFMREIQATTRCRFPSIRLVNFKNSDHTFVGKRVSQVTQW